MNAAFEGTTDLSVIHRMFASVGLELDKPFEARGKTNLDRKLGGYNNAAKFVPWFVLRDLDTGHCAPGLINALLPRPSSKMCFRIAVRAAEAWLLADAERMALFLSVPVHALPADPELLRDPKRAVVDLARTSRNRALREEMVPAVGTTARVGPAYTARIIEFARDHWRPEVAARSSDSLNRCLKALRQLARNV